MTFGRPFHLLAPFVNRGQPVLRRSLDDQLLVAGESGAHENEEPVRPISDHRGEGAVIVGALNLDHD
jgi:hypothetical protein